MQSADQTVTLAQLRLDGALLIAEVHSFVDAWQLVLASGVPWTQEQVSLLRERCRGLQRRARGAGQGGLAHHLQSCERCLGSPIPDRDEIGRCLGNVSQIGWQLQQELDRRHAEKASGQTPAPGPVREVDRERLPAKKEEQEVEKAAPADAALPAPVLGPSQTDPPALASGHAVVDSPSRAAFADAVAPMEAAPAQPSPAQPSPAEQEREAPPPLTVEASPSIPAAASIFAEPSPEISRAPSARVDGPQSNSVLATAGTQHAEVGAKAPSAVPARSVVPSVPRPRKLDPSATAPKQVVPPPLVPLPAVTDAHAAELRASLRAAAEAVAEEQGALVAIPLAAELDLGRQTQPKPRHVEDPHPAALSAQGLGMSSGPAAPEPTADIGRAAARSSAAPPQLGQAASGPPPMQTLAALLLRSSTPPDLDGRSERIRKAHSYPVQGRLDASASSGMLGSAEQFARDLRPRPRGIRWWVGPLGVCIVGSLAALGLGLRGVRRSPNASANTAALASVHPALLPSPRLTNDRERLAALLSQVHAHGGVESSELAKLLDEEAGVFRQALEQDCIPGSAGCELRTRAQQVLTPAVSPASPHPPAAPLGGWLHGLRLPEIGLHDDPRVRELVEFHTENPSGREQFQVLLFQCAAYEQLFHRHLLARTLPTDLIAVAMVQSGCVADAETALGGRGLWQFLPATARAYHLRVQSGVLDERLSPAKSTEAALGFLGDLYRKLHSWELAIAAYSIGPFGLLAQLEQAGGQLDYWDLAKAGLLPNETAGYVPKIQAFALILANLEHFRFETAQQHAAEQAATLSVPAGTRLGLVARAAASSGSRIRELNPDIIADTVPGLAGERFPVRVPNETTSRAHETLAHLLATEDHTDECVPLSFDWGRQRFTKAMASRCAEAAALPLAPPRPARGGSSRVGSATHARSSLR